MLSSRQETLSLFLFPHTDECIMYIKRLQIASSDVKKGGEEKKRLAEWKIVGHSSRWTGFRFVSAQTLLQRGARPAFSQRYFRFFFLYLLFFFLRADVNTEEPNSSIITPVRHNRMNLLLCTGPFIFFLGSFPLFSLPSSFLGVWPIAGRRYFHLRGWKNQPSMGRAACGATPVGCCAGVSRTKKKKKKK